MGRRRKPKDDSPKIGHNSGMISDENRKKIAGYIAEIESIEAQRADLKKDADEIYKAAGGANFDVKAMRAIIRERKVDRAKRQAFESVMDAYRHALGMLADTPLGEAALSTASRKERAERGLPADLGPSRSDTSDPPFMPGPDAEMPAAPPAPVS